MSTVAGSSVDTAGAARRVALAIAVATFALATASVFGRVASAGFERVILTERGGGPSSLALVFGEAAGSPGARDRWRAMLEADHRFTVFTTGRNAHALLETPLRIFDTESCHPAEGALAFGHPLLTFGLLGIPAQLATGDPVAVYNLVMLLLPFIAAFAMYLLVVEWTGVPAAGIAAGLLYGFHASKLENVYHPFAEDTGWTVFGLLFLSRFFARGRLSDGVGAAVAFALQVGSSLYSIVTSLVVSAPFALWLLWRYGLRAIRPGPALASLGVFSVAATWILLPYLRFLAPEGDAERSRIYASWDSVAPLGFGFALIAGLAALGLASRRGRGAADGRGVRLVLAFVAAACALIATGGNVNARRLAELAGRDAPIALPNLYEALAFVLPGIETVRVAGFTDAGTHLALCALAGLGAAGLVWRANGWARHAVAAGLVACAWVGALGAPRLFIPSPVAYATFEIRPPETTLAFFRELARIGNDGPIVEIPAPTGLTRISRNASRQLVAAYHHRRTSSCYNSYVPPVNAEVVALSEALPAEEAVLGLHRLGFTTILVHHPQGQFDAGWQLRRELEARAQLPDSHVRLIHETGQATAFAIE